MEAPAGFTDARRMQQSVLAAAEKRALVWMAERTPPWINSDHLTVLGSAAMMLTGAAFAAARWDVRYALLVVPFLALNWLGDSLDGTLARVRNHQRPRYGFYVDHIVDSFGATALLGGLALSGYMTPLIAAAVLIAFLLLSVETYLAAYARSVFRLSYGIFGPTELRVLLAVGAVMLLYRPVVQVAGRPYFLFDVGGVVGALGMFAILLYSTVRNTRGLYREEPLP
jgi:archaetidylinositol phosphate synthase